MPRIVMWCWQHYYAIYISCKNSPLEDFPINILTNSVEDRRKEWLVGWTLLPPNAQFRGIPQKSISAVLGERPVGGS